MSAAKRRRIMESCVSSTLCQLRKCTQASDWNRAAQLVEDLDGCSGCVQFVAHKAVQDQQWDWVVRLFDQCGLQQRSELVTGLLTHGQWQTALQLLTTQLSSEAVNNALRYAAQQHQWLWIAQLMEGWRAAGSLDWLCQLAVQRQQWDLVLQLIERGVSAALRNSLLQSALDHHHVLCTAKLMDLGVRKHCREEGIHREIASGHGDFILEVVRKVRDPELTDFVLRESMKESQWQLVSDLVKEGLSVAQMESVCDQAVADQQWTVALQLLRDGVSASDWMVSELFQNNKAQDLLDLFPAGSVPEGLKGLLLMASVRHGLGDLSLHILQRETVSDSELMEAIKYAVHLLDKTIFLKLIRECPKGRRVFKQKFIHQDWKDDLSPEENGCSDGGEVCWLYDTLYDEGEKDMALHVATSVLNFSNLYNFCKEEMNHFDLRNKKYQYALRKLHEDSTSYYHEVVTNLCKRPNLSKSDRSFLFCTSLRLEEFGLAVELCKYGVSRKDLKFATHWLLLEKADHSMFNSLRWNLDNKDRDWLKQYAVKVTMKQYFKLKSEANLDIFMQLFRSCYDNTLTDNIFRKAIEKCVKFDCADCFVALCKNRFKGHMNSLTLSQEEDCIFAYTSAVEGKRMNFISKVCKEHIVPNVLNSFHLHMPEVHLLLNIVIAKRAWDIMLSAVSSLKSSNPCDVCEILKECLQKMPYDQSTWSGIAPALDLLITGTDLERVALSREFADVFEQWSVNMSSLKQWCLDNGHPHLAFFLAVVTKDWTMMETTVSTQTTLDLHVNLLGKSVLMAAENNAFSTGAAILKISPKELASMSTFYELFSYKIKVPLAKACEDLGLLDWAFLLQSNDMDYVKEHHKHFDDAFVLNYILKQAAKTRKWDLVRELMPRCTEISDAPTSQFVLKAAVKQGQVDIAESLVSRVDPTFRDHELMPNQTLLCFAAESSSALPADSSSFLKEVGIDLIRLLIASGLSTFQRGIPFEYDSYYHNCPLLKALYENSVPSVKLMLACGAITHKRLEEIRKDSKIHQFLYDRRVDEDWKTGYRCILEAAATPCRLVHMARLVVSHSIGCGPGRSERIDILPVPEPIKDLVRFKDVLSMDLTVPEPAQDMSKDDEYSDSDYAFDFSDYLEDDFQPDSENDTEWI